MTAAVFDAPDNGRGDALSTGVSASARADVRTSDGPWLDIDRRIHRFGTAEVVASTDGMDRADWLELRRQGIGGSDAAAICGQDPWRSRFEVWAEKTGVLDAPERPETGAMRWGRILEDLVADELEASTPGLSLFRVGSMLAHPEHPWMLANIDRGAVAGDELGVVECKTTGAWSAGGWDGDAVPVRPLLQGMHYLAVTGLAWVIYAVLIGGQRFEVRKVDRDDELIDHLVALEAEFWDAVTSKVAPPPDGSQACTQFLAHLWDVRDGAVVTLEPAAVEPLLAERAQLIAAQHDLEERQDEVENRMKVLIGDATEALTPDGERLFTWREYERGWLDIGSLTAAHPDVVGQFTHPRKYRRLHVPTSARGQVA
jgi:putative phage-type endonuclease